MKCEEIQTQNVNDLFQGIKEKNSRDMRESEFWVPQVLCSAMLLLFAILHVWAHYYLGSILDKMRLCWDVQAANSRNPRSISKGKSP